jgi:hypothetical protein
MAIIISRIEDPFILLGIVEPIFHDAWPNNLKMDEGRWQYVTQAKLIDGTWMTQYEPIPVSVAVAAFESAFLCKLMHTSEGVTVGRMKHSYGVKVGTCAFSGLSFIEALANALKHRQAWGNT